jgi:hypothetical protein
MKSWVYEKYSAYLQTHVMCNHVMVISKALKARFNEQYLAYSHTYVTYNYSTVSNEALYCKLGFKSSIRRIYKHTYVMCNL